MELPFGAVALKIQGYDFGANTNFELLTKINQSGLGHGFSMSEWILTLNGKNSQFVWSDSEFLHSILLLSGTLNLNFFNREGTLTSIKLSATETDGLKFFKCSNMQNVFISCGGDLSKAILLSSNLKASSVSTCNSSIQVTFNPNLHQDILRSEGCCVGVDQFTLESLKIQATNSRLQRSRLCIHRDDQELLHEMFIHFNGPAAFPASYHLRRSESITILRGKLRCRIFSTDGKSSAEIPLSGSYEEGVTDDYNYLFIPKEIPHEFFFDSHEIITKETTLGPFDPKETVML